MKSVLGRGIFVFGESSCFLFIITVVDPKGCPVFHLFKIKIIREQILQILAIDLRIHFHLTGQYKFDKASRRILRLFYSFLLSVMTLVER